MILFYLGDQARNTEEYLSLLQGEPYLILQKNQWDLPLSQIFDHPEKGNDPACNADFPRPLMILQDVDSEKALTISESMAQNGLVEPILCMTTANNMSWPFKRLIFDVSLEAKTMELMEKISSKLYKADRFRFNLDKKYADTYMKAATLLRSQADFPLLAQVYQELLALDPHEE